MALKLPVTGGVGADDTPAAVAMAVAVASTECDEKTPSSKKRKDFRSFCKYVFHSDTGRVSFQICFLLPPARRPSTPP